MSTAKAPADTVDALFLSPHLDDAVFSCGAEISRRARLGERIVVATLFAGPPQDDLSRFAAEIHELWEIPTDVVAGRRAEDRLALQVVGASPIHLGIPDALYRRGPDGAPLFESLEALRRGDIRRPYPRARRNGHRRAARRRNSLCAARDRRSRRPPRHPNCRRNLARRARALVLLRRLPLRRPPRAATARFVATATTAPSTFAQTVPRRPSGQKESDPALRVSATRPRRARRVFRRTPGRPPRALLAMN